jgi:hypothetical protein
MLLEAAYLDQGWRRKMPASPDSPPAENSMLGLQMSSYDDDSRYARDTQQ